MLARRCRALSSAAAVREPDNRDTVDFRGVTSDAFPAKAGPTMRTRFYSGTGFNRSHGAYAFL